MTIGDRIRLARKATGLSQERLGKYCGVTKQTIYKYEKGVVTNIPLDNIETIANATNVTTAYLMGWPESEPDRNNRLLELMHELNEDGRERVIQYAVDLINSGNYVRQ